MEVEDSEYERANQSEMKHNTSTRSESWKTTQSKMRTGLDQIKESRNANEPAWKDQKI
jgi:hypothetical protein